MTRVSQLRRAPTRALLTLSLLGLGWTYGCSSDSTGSAPPPVIAGSGNAGSAGSAHGGSSASGGEAGAPSDAGTAGSLGGGGAGGSAGSAGTAGNAGGAGASGSSGASGAGGSSGKGGSSGASGGGASGGTSGAGGSAGGGGTISTICGAQLSVAGGTQLPISTAADDTFGGISADELTIAWTASAAGTVTLWYAERASPSAVFDTPKSLVIDAAADQLTLANDGLSVAFVDADRLGFSELTRGAFGDSFTSAGSGDFSALAAATAMLPTGESYGDPLFVSDTLLYYSRFGAGRTQTLFLTSRFSSGDSWPPGGAATLPSNLQGSGTDHAHPTGVSSDGYTLFVWNDATSSELALSLNQQTGALEAGSDLGNRKNAAPNAACTRLYYSAPGTGGMDLFVADLQ